MNEMTIQGSFMIADFVIEWDVKIRDMNQGQLTSDFLQAFQIFEKPK